jgi:hypothetical protein
MVAQLNPYDAPPAGPQAELTLRSKIFAGAVGCFVLTGSAITMGIVLIAVLILNAGRTQPTPIPEVVDLSPLSSPQGLAGPLR